MSCERFKVAHLATDRCGPYVATCLQWHETVQGKDVGSQWMHNYRPSDAQLAILSRAVDGGEAHGGPNNLAPPSLPGNYNQQVLLLSWLFSKLLFS